MNARTVYTYPAAYERDIAAARRRYGALAEDMPPVVIKFLLNVFGSAWPVERRGARWTVTTPLQHIEIETSSPLAARLRVWSARASRDIDSPCIDRLIACKGKEEEEAS